jgi:hypothetical protein
MVSLVSIKDRVLDRNAIIGENNLERYKNHCFSCGNMGKKGSPCPECGKQSDSLVLETEVTQDVSNILPELESLVIPNYYWGVSWNSSLLWQDHQDKSNDISFQKFVGSVERLHTIFVNNRLPTSSIIIASKPRFSKTVLAYSCIQYALKSGYSVSPILDTAEVKRLIVLASENPKYKPMGIEYEQYVNSDVVFITVQKDEYRRFCSQTILSIIDKRSRRGKSTIILSSYRLDDLCDGDKTGEFVNLFSDNFQDNRSKIPALIKYF